ncbi:NAD(P)-binding protein [Marasmius fiardii PR-910]|nr:NAD(P)-binding protein [Marasmius fiardii PR-910]
MSLSEYKGTGSCLITGSAQGVGKAIALRLAKDGFNIALNDLPSKQSELQQLENEIKGLGKETKTTIVTGDVSSEAEVKVMVERVAEELEGLDVMIANAGICPSGIMTESTIYLIRSFLFLSTQRSSLLVTAEQWDKTFSVNSRGTFLCYKYAAIQMIKQGRGGRIIGASSLAGKRGGAYFSAYSATKFAVRGMTQSAAWELGRHGITVNAYAPDVIDTEMGQGVITDLQKFNPALSKATVFARTPFGRLGEADEVAALVSFLASKDSNFITGKSEFLLSQRYPGRR